MKNLVQTIIIGLAFHSGFAFAATTVERVPRARYERPSFTAAKYEINLNYALFKGTQWTEEQVANQAREVAEVYEQCSLRIGAVTIFKLDNPLPNDLAYREESTFLRLAERTPIAERPLVFLIEEMLNAEQPTPFSKAQFLDMNGAVEPAALLNTIWVPYFVNSEAYLKARVASPYSVVAHELGHILLLDGMHNGEETGNLMTIWRWRTNRVTPQQCADMVKSELVRLVVPST